MTDISTRPATRGRAFLRTVVVGAATAALVASGAAMAHAATTDGFNPDPTRLLDTRADLPDHPRGPVQTFTQVTLPDSVGDGATALLSVTVPNPKTQGYIKVYPDGTAPPATSDVNFVKGPTFAQEVMVSPGDGGRVNLAVGGNSAPIDIVVDVVGSFPSTSFTSLSPAQRIYDTRTPAIGTTTGRKGTGQYLVTLPVGENGVPDDATAVAVTLTQANALGSGYIRVQSDATGGTTSAINYTSSTIASNLVWVKPTDGKFVLGVVGNPTNIIVDVKGYSVSNRVTAQNATRLADSRSGLGGITGPQFGTVAVTLPTSAPAGADFAALNVTATGSKSSGWIASYKADAGKLQTSNINFSTGQTIGGFLLVPIVDGKATFYVGYSPTQVVVDLEGYVTNAPEAK
ncbi:hypothetical protein ACXR2U_17230 [Jatrophihabitans sp. YIM 134969]